MPASNGTLWPEEASPFRIFSWDHPRDDGGGADGGSAGAGAAEGPGGQGQGRPEVTEVILSEQRSPDLEQDQSWWTACMSLSSCCCNTTQCPAESAIVVLLGMDILSALVSRLQERFRTQVGTVLPSLMDRLGDAKDQVRDGAMNCLIEIYRHVGERAERHLQQI
ncbi:hypothetical protein F7725_008865 [Dissostichus mawsoni]|uniref:TOG domain-containing protein n=1 Tax=Dissostichus mawsoni TaxID=36200 RepID=A0A7J5Z5V2_DISMA|nr:hypothetical protein F7725_008865 [Dissostichus mawsoni]